MFSLQTEGTLHLVQITDAHLFKDADGELLGVRTLDSFQAVVEQVHQQRKQIDALLITGDLVQDGTLGAYERLKRGIETFSRPSFWLEGNHDNPETMAKAALGHEHQQRVIRSPHWQIIMLNSQVVREVHGYLEPDQLQLLQQALTERPDLHTLICCHHHPIDMGSSWIDTIGIHNADALWDIIDQHTNVRAVLWGHVHQDYNKMRGDVRLMSTPSTCFQFKPKSEDFSLDDIAPGYRWLDLLPNGAIETEVCRLEHIRFEVDFTVGGY